MPVAADLRLVLDAVSAEPGLSRAAVADRLGVRRTTALELLDQALAAELVHQADSVVPVGRGRAVRAVRGLYPGPGADELVLMAPPTTSGERVRALRTRAGVSLGALAGCLGISRSTVHSWETDRQAVPAWVTDRLPGALEAAQMVRDGAPRRHRDIGTLARLLQVVGEQPGICRSTLVGNSPRARQLLDDALAAGLLHEAPPRTERRRGRQEYLGIYRGNRPRQVQQATVSTSELRQARLGAGWSQEALARRLGVARPTLEGYELRLEAFPAWLTPAAAAALAAARAAARDVPAEQRARVLAEIEAAGLDGLTLKEVRRRLGWGPGVLAAVGELLAAGDVQEAPSGRSGERTRLYREAPREVLAPAELRELRESRGLTQAQAGELVGAHKVTVCEWEIGTKRIPPAVQPRLRTALEAVPLPGPAPADVLTPAELLAARKRAGLTQVELAALIGLKVASTISDWETGRKSIPLERQHELRTVLGLAKNGAAAHFGPEQAHEAL